MTELHETEIDGVRCFWVETGRPTLQASLIFRQGQADEPLTETGWLHLLEHMVLHGKGGGALSINGSVSILRTTLDAHGPAAAVVEHLDAVTSWLSDPDLSALDHERDVLAAEAAGRGGPASRALAWRYGARGPGVANYDEPGLGRATPEGLARRAASVFTTGNAALVLDGPPPPDLRLHLPEGDLLLPSPAVPCEDQVPAVYRDDAGLILTGVVERSPDAVAVSWAVERLLRERLREDAGGAYAPWSGYEPVDHRHALLMAGSDLTPKIVPTAFDEVARLAHEIRDRGVPQRIVDEYVALRVQGLNDPYQSVGVAYGAAAYALDAETPKSLDELLDDVRGISAVTMQQSAWAFTETLMVGVHRDSPVPETWRSIVAPSHFPRPVGRLFRHRDWPGVVDELRIDDDVVQVSAAGYARSVQMDDLEGCVAFSDGGRLLVTGAGWTVGIEPSEWRDGATDVSLVDAMVGADRLLPRSSDGFTAAPRMSAVRRWSRATRRVLRGYPSTRLIGPAIATMMLLSLVSQCVAARGR